MGKVFHGASLGDRHVSPARQGLASQAEAAPGFITPYTRLRKALPAAPRRQSPNHPEPVGQDNDSKAKAATQVAPNPAHHRLRISCRCHLLEQSYSRRRSASSATSPRRTVRNRCKIPLTLRNLWRPGLDPPDVLPYYQNHNRKTIESIDAGRSRDIQSPETETSLFSNFDGRSPIRK